MNYPVKEPLLFDRPTPYLPGDTVTMLPEEAESLIANGILGEGTPVVKKHRSM